MSGFPDVISLDEFAELVHLGPASMQLKLSSEAVMDLLTCERVIGPESDFPDRS